MEQHMECNLAHWTPPMKYKLYTTVVFNISISVGMAEGVWWNTYVHIPSSGVLAEVVQRFPGMTWAQALQFLNLFS
jgi:hypothetical protein